jgi:plastocyanin
LLKRVIGAVGLIAVAAAGLALGFARPGAASPRAAKGPTRITVAASEFKFVFSKRSIPATGTVIFTVVNRGKISHNFKIAGKRTPTLSPGKSATLTVRFAKKGHYPYLCTIFGHAAAGMKGVFSVATAAVAPPPSSTTTTTQPTTTTTTGTVGNAQTTVTVNMVEYAFQLSQTTVPSGQVTFVIHNGGVAVHNFDLEGVKVGALLAPGTSETWTVALAPGTYIYQCDVPFHAQRGMIANLTVTS